MILFRITVIMSSTIYSLLCVRNTSYSGIIYACKISDCSVRAAYTFGTSICNFATTFSIQKITNSNSLVPSAFLSISKCHSTSTNQLNIYSLYFHSIFLKTFFSNTSSLALVLGFLPQYCNGTLTASE